MIVTLALMKNTNYPTKQQHHQTAVTQPSGGKTGE
jgi:hypothetical protein